MLNDKTIKKILLDEKLTTEKKFKELEKDAQDGQKSLEDFLLDQKLITEESLYQRYAELNDLPFINLKEKNIRQDILELVPEPIALNHEVIAFETKDDKVKLATLEPGDLQTQEFIKKKQDSNPKYTSPPQVHSTSYSSSTTKACKPSSKK